MTSPHAITDLLTAAMKKLAADGIITRIDGIKTSVRQEQAGGHGDFSSPIALALASSAQQGTGNALALAKELVSRLERPDWLDRVEIAGPGFINFYLRRHAAAAELLQVLHADATPAEIKQRVLLEFVSSNPTGPLHVGHGRGAVIGNALAALYRADGDSVECEYYINDRGRQSLVLAVSAWLCFLKLEKPEGTYQGEYVADLAAPEADCFNLSKLDAAAVRALLKKTETAEKEARLDALIAALRCALGAPAVDGLCRRLHERVMTTIRGELDLLGVHFDHWFHESSLYRRDANGNTEVDRMVAKMLRDKVAEKREDGAVWFLSQRFGDDKDRVLVRANGEPTYFASDVAYHLNKLQRGYDRLVNVWGADHHGYEARLRGALKALGKDDSRLKILFVQFVALVEGGERISMSTRAGSFVPLSELCQRVEPDAVKLTFLTCDSGRHLDFDLALAVSQRRENPVFYIQYAHARICSVERKLEEMGTRWQLPPDAELLRLLPMLSSDKEQQLRREILRFSHVVHNAAARDEPHRLTTYLKDLAALFHSWYNDERILADDTELRDARLAFSRIIKRIFAEGLQLLGLDAPEFM